MVECFPEEEKVGGSSPPLGTFGKLNLIPPDFEAGGAVFVEFGKAND